MTRALCGDPDATRGNVSYPGIRASDPDPVGDVSLVEYGVSVIQQGSKDVTSLVGVLVYGTGETRLRIEDPTLAHVKTITLMKLRRNESFALTIRQDSSNEGRTTLWLHPAIALQFTFDSDDLGEVDRPLLEELMHEANTGEIVVRTGAKDDSTTTTAG